MSTVPASVGPPVDFTGKMPLYHWARRLLPRARKLWPAKVFNTDNNVVHMGVILPQKLFGFIQGKAKNNKWKVLPDGSLQSWDDPTLIIWNIYNPRPE